MGEILKRQKGGQFIGYYLRFYEGGRRRIMASKQQSYADARRMLLEIEARIARGEVGVAEKRQVPTLKELVERFLTEYSRPAIKDLERYRTHARTNLKRAEMLFSKPADQIGQSDIARLREGLLSRYASGSAKLTLVYLSAVFAWAVREGLVVKNPCVGVERPPVDSSLDFLSKEEVRRLVDTAAAQADVDVPMRRMLYFAVSLALHTGLRKGEILGLRWTDLDFATRRLTVARSYGRTPKSSKARHLRLPLVLAPLLEAWRRDCPSSAAGVVFPVGLGWEAAKDGAMLGLRRLWREAGLREVPHPWHVLRHTMASHFIMAGGNILALQKILGHSDLTMTLVYAHLAPDFLDGELDRLRY